MWLIMKREMGMMEQRGEGVTVIVSPEGVEVETENSLVRYHLSIGWVVRPAVKSVVVDGLLVKKHKLVKKT